MNYDILYHTFIDLSKLLGGGRPSPASLVSATASNNIEWGEGGWKWYSIRAKTSVVPPTGFGHVYGATLEFI